MVIWNTFDTTPEVGRKFIALYNDGSGSNMFVRLDDTYIDTDGDEYYEFDDGSYIFWAYLPEKYEFWCENREEDPFSL
jgi:hypothetical protein